MIWDFGISEVIDSGNAVLTRTYGTTPVSPDLWHPSSISHNLPRPNEFQYTAPEAFLGSE